MNAGKLDQRVTLQALSGGVDEIGEPLAGREYIAAGAMVSAVETRIRLRYRPGVVSSMRVIHGDTVYGIEAVIHVKSARRELQLMCKAVA